ncbi:MULTISPECIES: nitroreductase [Sphingobium]|jgi:nitroreductase|uniref:NADH dehydrogenase n=3 Tax=Sphingobium fuliginis (strain ATCC 27551) TaxID=336203 RepID=A0A292ZGJ5_SPHSA|nr:MULTISPECIES: nitroreductase [Sphingobium]PNQ03712.1 nitroreductase [Sphingobium sp. SA916]QOT71761.1 nitroreductase [Sphingobium fuliginis]GAY22557.1 NADH dehydrogenase [Sphingobium fuliginis]
MDESKLFHDVVRERRSVRAFLPTPVPDALMQAVVDDARHAPSNANIQPWSVHIVSGAKRDELSKAMLEAEAAGRLTPDFPFGYDELYGVYSDRQKAQAAAYYEALGVAREAFDERRMTMLRNLEFFGAPHACLLFMPSFYDSVRIAGDVGMYAQTFLLSLAAHGLGGVPQTLLGFFAETAREVLGIDPSLKMLFGISFGYPDLDSAASRYWIGKTAIQDHVTFHK